MTQGPFQVTLLWGIWFNSLHLGQASPLTIKKGLTSRFIQDALTRENATYPQQGYSKNLTAEWQEPCGSDLCSWPCFGILVQLSLPGSGVTPDH